VRLSAEKGAMVILEVHKPNGVQKPSVVHKPNGAHKPVEA
jgi:hypothetical protein